MSARSYRRYETGDLERSVPLAVSAANVALMIADHLLFETAGSIETCSLDREQREALRYAIDNANDRVHEEFKSL